MTGISRRTFGQITAGIGVLGAGKFSGSCSTSGPQHTAPASQAPWSGTGIGFVFTRHQPGHPQHQDDPISAINFYRTNVLPKPHT